MTAIASRNRDAARGRGAAFGLGDPPGAAGRRRGGHLTGVIAFDRDGRRDGETGPRLDEETDLFRLLDRATPAMDRGEARQYDRAGRQSRLDEGASGGTRRRRIRPCRPDHHHRLALVRDRLRLSAR